MRISDETIWASADSIVTDNLADGTRCARLVFCTWIDTLSVPACSVIWTIIVTFAAHCYVWHHRQYFHW